MAPTYKDLAKTWLSNWLASVRGAPTRVYMCTQEEIVSACRCGRGHKPCPDRYTLDVTHYTREPILFRNSRLFTGECEFSVETQFRVRASYRHINASCIEHEKKNIIRMIAIS